MATLEHIKPQSLGGTDHFYNVIMTCSRCNCRRGIKDIFVFSQSMQDPELRVKLLRSGAQVRREAAERRAIRKAEKHPERFAKAAFRLAWVAHNFPEFNDFLDQSVKEFDLPLAA